MQFSQLKRRAFITLLGGAAAAWPLAARAQQLERVRRIGVLMELAASDLQARSNVAALQRGLHGLGWREGSNLGIEYRWAPDDPVLVWKFAKELVELRCDVIVAHSSPVVATLLGQTRNIPIVFVSISDPIGEGFVASFARPGGNVTGFTNFESSMTGKWVELLKDIAPELTRVSFLFNPQTAAGGGSYFLGPIDAAATTLKVKAAMALVHDDDEIEAAIAALAREPGAGVVLRSGALRLGRPLHDVAGRFFDRAALSPRSRTYHHQNTRAGNRQKFGMHSDLLDRTSAAFTKRARCRLCSTPHLEALGTIRVQMKAPWTDPKLAGAARAGGTRCPRVWFCVGARSFLIRRCFWRRLRPVVPGGPRSNSSTQFADLASAGCRCLAPGRRTRDHSRRVRGLY
jgi:ABC transporter substrate binding protein